MPTNAEQKSDDQSERAQNVRAEYAALVAYHNLIVTLRFTLLGIYLAAVAFLAKGMDSNWINGLLVVGLTLASYVVERRNRDLYKQMAFRASEIERLHWNFNRCGPHDKSLSVFSLFLIIHMPPEVKAELPEELKDEAKYLETSNRWSLSRLPSSHSKGLDVLYALIALYAAISAAYAIYQKWNGN